MSKFDDAQNQTWYAVVNDLIGGWAIALVDKPLSQHDWNSNKNEGEIADFMTEEIARYICKLHNRELRLFESLREANERWMSGTQGTI